MAGLHPEGTEARSRQQGLDALAHLAGRAAREGCGQDLVGTDPGVADEVRDAVREDPRLARARPGGHDDRPLRR